MDKQNTGINWIVVVVVQFIVFSHCDLRQNDITISNSKIHQTEKKRKKKARNGGDERGTTQRYT